MAVNGIKSVDELLRLGKLPSCPTVLASLNQAQEDPSTPISELARMLSLDQALTVKILKVVNSAALALPRKVQSVEEAVFRLGFQEIWSLAIGIQANDMYKESASMWDTESDSLWQHSLKVAILAKLLGGRNSVRKPSEMFTAGIVHDIGKLILFFNYKETFSTVCEKGTKAGAALCSEEIKHWHVSHSSLGAALLRRWGIPDSLANMVEYHHNPNWQGRLDTATAMLSVADALAHAAKSEEGIIHLDFSAGLLTPEIAQTLKLDGPECVRLVTTALKSYDDLIKEME
jgi:putative nucleotidyltransferase with HDIG domain